MNKTGKCGEVRIVEINRQRRPVSIISNDNVVVELEHLIATVQVNTYQTFTFRKRVHF